MKKNEKIKFDIDKSRKLCYNTFNETVKCFLIHIIKEVKMGLEKTMKALADPVRREILNLLKQGRLSAGDIVAHFDITGAAISRHLSILKEADLIRDSREGKFIYYDLNVSVLEEILMWISTLKGDKND